MPAMVSTTALGPKEHPVATVSLDSSAFYFLVIGPAGDDSMNAIIEKAKKKFNVDSMVNVFVDRSETCFPFCVLPLFKWVDTKIFGTLVVYDDPAIPKVVAPKVPFVKEIENDPESGLLKH